MLGEWAMFSSWLIAGAAIGSFTTYRLMYGITIQSREDRLRGCITENEALNRTNSIYRERIEQLENALFSNEKYLAMAGEIERLSADNFRLRGRLRDLVCLVEVEKKKTAYQRVEHLEKSILDMRQKMDYERQTGLLSLSGREISVTIEAVDDKEAKPTSKEPKRWGSIQRAKRI